MISIYIDKKRGMIFFIKVEMNLLNSKIFYKTDIERNP